MTKNKNNKHNHNTTNGNGNITTTTATTTTTTTTPPPPPPSKQQPNNRIQILGAIIFLLFAIILGRYAPSMLDKTTSNKQSNNKTFTSKTDKTATNIEQQHQQKPSSSDVSQTTTTTSQTTTTTVVEQGSIIYPPRIGKNENGEEVPTMHMSFPQNAAPSGIFTLANNNNIDITFTLCANGDGTGEGISIKTSEYKHIDDIISKHCCSLMNMTSTPQVCAPNSGARIVNDVGVRVMSYADLEHGRRAYCVPQGLHFVWPLTGVGSVIYPKNVVGPNPVKPIKMTQLSNRPRVFSVDNFVAQSEIVELLNNNRDKVTRSEVGFYGWQDDTRTSFTSWDFNSLAAIAIQKRTFEILGMDYEPQMADAMQVLRYTPDGFQGKGEWYKPHVDWFSADGYDGSVPKVDNGTNRFATMFLYLSDVEEGGHTVFPLSTSHAGYDGQQIVHPGTVDTPGYINTGEARAACNDTATTALRVVPKAMNAVLFYSQGPDGDLDPWSLHGGCPPIKGTKWSANVWIWNRIRPDKSKAKDKPKGMKEKPHPLAMTASFKNKHSQTVVLYWDSSAPSDTAMVDYEQEWKNNQSRFTFQYDLNPEVTRDMNTYDQHAFVAFEKGTQKFIWAGKMDKSKILPGDDSILIEVKKG
jgi:hypothetical protein